MHHYRAHLRWTGNTGTGTSGYWDYARDYELQFAGKADVLLGSADPAFRAAPGRYNPEELLLGSLSACHLLWYLHLCADAGIRVLAYEDAPTATLQLDADGGGCFTGAVLYPTVTLAPGADTERARALHATAHRRCFIARSCNFPVRRVPRFVFLTD